MIFNELIDDALTDIQAFVTFENLTVSQKVRVASEGLHVLQKKTSVLEKIITVDATTLDSEGSVALDKSVTVPRRGTYAVAGGAPCEVRMIGRDEMSQRRNMSQQVGYPPNKLFVALERSRLFFLPFQGLKGTFTLNCVAKMPIYSASLAADTTSFWSGWTTGSALDTKFKTIEVPQEFDDAQEGLTAYCAARFLELIPGWRKRFLMEHEAFMGKFHASADSIKENLPNYLMNYPATAEHW